MAVSSASKTRVSHHSLMLTRNSSRRSYSISSLILTHPTFPFNCSKSKPLNPCGDSDSDEDDIRVYHFNKKKGRFEPGAPECKRRRPRSPRVTFIQMDEGCCPCLCPCPAPAPPVQTIPVPYPIPSPYTGAFPTGFPNPWNPYGPSFPAFNNNLNLFSGGYADAQAPVYPNTSDMYYEDPCSCCPSGNGLGSPPSCSNKKAQCDMGQTEGPDTGSSEGKKAKKTRSLQSQRRTKLRTIQQPSPPEETEGKPEEPLPEPTPSETTVQSEHSTGPSESWIKKQMKTISVKLRTTFGSEVKPAAKLDAGVEVAKEEELVSGEPEIPKVVENNNNAPLGPTTPFELPD